MSQVPPARRVARCFVALTMLTCALPAAAEFGDTELVSVHYAPPASFHLVRVRDVTASAEYVMFESDSPFFVPNDTDDRLDVFVRDRLGGTTRRVNLSSTGALVPITRIEQSRLSVDGRFAIFVSSAANVVPGDTNGGADVFLRDIQAGTTERVSVSSTGAQYAAAYDPSMDASAQFISFVSPDKVIHVRDRVTRQTTDLEVPGLRGVPLLSGDGRYLVYWNFDRLIRLDRTSGQKETVNVNAAGQLANRGGRATDVSVTGRYVLFYTDASNLVAGDTAGTYDAFVRDLERNVTERVSVKDDGTPFPYTGPYATPRISSDGYFVTFTADVRTVPGESISDVFVRDRVNKTTRLVSLNSHGQFANASSFTPAPISYDGHFVAFTSQATNLAPGDTEPSQDAFLHHLPPSVLSKSFSIRPRAVDCGDRNVGTSNWCGRLEVTNTGNAGLAIAWIGLAGRDASQYSQTRECPAVLQAGATCFVVVYFAPTTAGDKSARLVVSTENGTLRRSASLAGTGL